MAATYAQATTVETDESDLTLCSTVEIMALVHVGMAVSHEDFDLTPDSIDSLIRSVKEHRAVERAVRWMEDRESQFTESGYRVLQDFYRAFSDLTQAGSEANNFKNLQCNLALAAKSVNEVANARKMLTYHERTGQDRWQT